MAGTSQPGFLSAWINAFTTFDEAHGFAVNLFVVAALAITGAAFLSGRPRLIRPEGALQALAVDRTTMTVRQLASGSPAWAKAQSINVPIQFGSSS